MEPALPNASFSGQIDSLRRTFDALSTRRLLLFGGKGGVGKTTISSLAALHFSRDRRVVLFSTDPASNLRDLFTPDTRLNLEIESVDAGKLYEQFLATNLPSFLELGDRGTYLDRDEIARFFELSLPGLDELMAWLRIGELAKTRSDAMLIVDTAPTGHTLRMLGSSSHFRSLGEALETMQAKHRDLVEQLSRRRLHDALDEFIERFQADAEERRAMLSDARLTAFVPVLIAEPWVVEQTSRLIDDLRAQSIPIPLAILNRAAHDAECERCRARRLREDEARSRLPSLSVVEAPDACAPLDSVEALDSYLAGTISAADAVSSRSSSSSNLSLDSQSKMIFFAGKGGVGKTSCSASVALQLAEASPASKFVLISVDPAHSLRDVFASIAAPPNLEIVIIDTRAKWQRFRDSIGQEIDNAIGALTPRGVSIAHDSTVMKQLIEIAPPGADELFAIMRLSDLLEDDSLERIVVDTAPTGHFLRLIDLPRAAGEWVREFMRLLLKYKDLIPPSSLGEDLVRASKALKAFDAALQSPKVAAVIVSRPERIVAEETSRLIDALRERGVAMAGIVVNAVTPKSGCRCDEIRANAESAIIARFPEAIVIQRRESPPNTEDDLRKLVPMRHTSSR